MAQCATDAQLHMLDLPQLHSKPSFTSLSNTLTSLAAAPASWTVTTSQPPLINEDGIPAYLTRLISSSLSWLCSDTEKEQIWELASQRLSERSGRTAMSSFERTFTVPALCTLANHHPTLDIRIYEPGLTGDQIGHKTWLGAYVLAKRSHLLLPQYFHQLIPSAGSLASSPSLEPVLRILELGAGTGLAGLAAAALFPKATHVRLTDLPEIIPNLQANLERNSTILAPSCVTADVLDWSDLPSALEESKKYDCILAADLLYGPEHPALLANAIATLLKRCDRSRVFTVLPFRQMDRDYHAELRTEMATRGFEILEEGAEQGVEDWYNWGMREEVLCWWCVWGWNECEEENVLGGRIGREEECVLGKVLSEEGDDGDIILNCHRTLYEDEYVSGGAGGSRAMAQDELCRLIPEMLEIW